VLISLLAEKAGKVYGVDPSLQMVGMAARRNRAAVRAGRVSLALGDAAATGLETSTVDWVVSVNNAPIWPDLPAGVAEIRRVLAPKGTALIAWHGGTSPTRTGARLRLAPDKLARMESALADVFSTVTREQLTTLDVFLAR
jgi:SAM-dependent methyltransferase